MIDDIKTVMWKEWKENILTQRGSSKRMTWFRIGFSIFIFGFVFPMRAGARYVESPLSLIFPSIVPVLMIIAIVADSFAGERERHTLETLLASQLQDDAILIGKMLTAVLFALAVALLMMITGLVGANFASGNGHLLLFPLDRFLAVLSFDALLAMVVSSAGVLVSLRASTVRQAMQTMGIGFMVFFYGLGLGVPFLLPAEWRARLIQFFLGQN